MLRSSLRILLRPRGTGFAAQARSFSTPKQAYYEIGLGHFKQSLSGNQSALPKARQAWQLGAEQGLANCQNALGGLCLKEGDLEKAQFYFKQAADNGHARAATELGKILLARVQKALQTKEDHSTFSSGMVQYFSDGVKAGHPEAFWGLSQCYDHGYGVAQCHNEARKLLQRAADANHPEALFRLGDHYRLGLGVASDLGLALQLYRNAADLGVCAAQFNFGVMHLLGKGVAVNEEVGTRYLFLACQQGHTGALFILGDLFYHGKAGLPRKPDEAEKFFRQAAEAGNPQAIAALEAYGMQPAKREP